jgi:pimeloyl-ACP methyl ester carboxylesterase
MDTATSKDGTKIAYDKSGSGAALVLVSAIPDRSANAQLVELLSPHFTVYNYDRRGHGDSGDTQPWAVEREVEDLEAVIDEAGGSAFAYGSSGNGIFALHATARGLSNKIRKLAVWEPPFIVDDSRPPLPKDYKEQLAKLLEEGRRGDMVELFLTQAVGMPAEFVTPMRLMPMWPAFEAMAHTLLYDASIVGDFSLPFEVMAKVTAPTLVLDGGQASAPWIRNGLDVLVKVLPHVERRTLEGQPHNVDSAAIAPVLVEFFKAS